MDLLRAIPAYLNLGDVRVKQGNDTEAARTWETMLQIAPERAYLAFGRLQALAVRTGNPERFPRLCRELIDQNPQDWRATASALSRHLSDNGQPQEALQLLFAALVHNPHGLSIHQAIWQALGHLRHPSALVDRYSELTQHAAIFYLDPHRSACAAAIAAPNCSGNARIATTGIRLWRSALRRLEAILCGSLDPLRGRMLTKTHAAKARRTRSTAIRNGIDVLRSVTYCSAKAFWCLQGRACCSSCWQPRSPATAARRCSARPQWHR